MLWVKKQLHFADFLKIRCQKSIMQKIESIMKKLILNPVKDTVTLCLPEDWVGKTVICLLKDPGEEEVEMVGLASEGAIFYQAERYRRLAKRRPRRKRLRRRQV